ncbi:Aldo/keto reductase family-domain-containing protein [Tricladium varicosporioides]|nr:Aldo/keto reductase family-domain-containing protein [Hymenoscyphus varicosporioides]
MGSQYTPPLLSQKLPSLILGGAGFSYITHPDPKLIPVAKIIKQAFNHGMRAIDTSPFYEPSEELLGQALSQAEITDSYSRSDYVLMTKVGRLPGDIIDYSPTGVRKSVTTSLQRLRTTYLDVVFCHDIEFATDEETLEAVGELLDLIEEGKVRYVGLSSYHINLLSKRAVLVRERFGRPVDVIQNYAQMNLQSSNLEVEGLRAFKSAGVSCVCNSSPLAIGLLRSGGVPQGKQGDFHPAPTGLRKAAQGAADAMAARGESLAAVGLRYALWRAEAAKQEGFRVNTIVGISTMAELIENIETAMKILKVEDGPNRSLSNPTLNTVQASKDLPLYEKVQEVLGEWVNYSFFPPK